MKLASCAQTVRLTLSILLLLPLGWSAGCSRDDGTDLLLEEVRLAREESLQLSRSFQESQERHAVALGQFREEIDSLRTRYRDSLADYEKRIQQQEQIITMLQQQQARSEEPAEEPPAEQVAISTVPLPPHPNPPHPTLQVRRYSSIADDFLEPPGDDNPDHFPLRIFDVTGSLIVTGSRTVHTPFESDELERSASGEKRPVIRWKESEIEQAQYEVRYSLENLTRTKKCAYVRAGLASVPVILEAGETLSDQTINAARGSGLRVRVSASSRSVPVAW